MRILVAEPIADQGLALLRAGAEVDVKKLNPQELLATVGEYEAVITRSETKITAEVLAAGSRLKVVGRAGVGVDNIDVPAATDRGVVVVNVPGGNTLSTCEYTFAMMLAMVRRIPPAMAALKGGKWDKKTYTGIELYGKTLGIIGLGRIGYEVATRARAFGMQVVAHDPYVSPARVEKLGARLATLPELLTQVDILTIHAAKTSETAALIRAKEIAMMKDGAYVINCARGGMIDEAALYEALKSGKLGGAAMDVYTTEPITEHPLFTLPNVIFTPHLAASTAEAQEANGVLIAQQVLKVLRGELVPDAVNLPLIPPDAAQSIVRHLPLAETLGSFLGQAYSGPAHELEITYQGELAHEPTALVTNTVLKGFLMSRVEESVNFINAPAVAKRYGLTVKESKPVDTGAAAQNVIKVKLQVGKQEREVTGTLGWDSGIRLTSINGLPVDMNPGRHMVVTRHHDRPGMLGQFGTILGREGINIAGLHLGRKSKAGEAVAVFLVDDVPTRAALEALAAVDGILEARAIALPNLPNGV